MPHTRSWRFSSQVLANFRLVLVVLLLQYLSPNTRGTQARPFKKVVGGTAAPKGRFPYMCSLRKRGNREHVCGGTLIKSKWVLTAAHCVERQQAGLNPVVYCGIYERTERNSSKTFTADRAFIHPEWTGDYMDGYDIALIKLDRASDSPNPDLPEQGSRYMFGSDFAALGWGVDASGSLADLLQIADKLRFVPTENCNIEEYWGSQITESMICAGFGEQDTQRGDSGGPLLNLDYLSGNYTLGEPSVDLLVGITSFGEDSGGTLKPGVYTNISYFRQWIECITKEKKNCWRSNQGTTEAATVAEEASSTSSSINDKDSPSKRFPYMCSIRRRGDRGHVCGGTLIKSRWVLTAAQCLDPKVVGSTGLSPVIYCGIYERNERNSSKAFSSDRSYLHPEWKGNIMEGYDIALIKLEKPHDSPLPDMDSVGNDHTSGTVFAALGWGVDLSGNFAEMLKVISRLPFVSTRICNMDDYWDGQIKDSMICAGIGQQDNEQGDSGGPLLNLDFLAGDYTLGDPSFDLLVGITSFGDRSGETFKPVVYTRIAYFRDWIDCVVEEKEDCSNDGQRTIESAVGTEASNSTSVTTIPNKEDAQLSPTAGASYVSPETSGDPSALFPEPLAEASIEAFESLAEDSEEATQRLEAVFDFCTDIPPQRNFNETLALQRARDALPEDDSDTVQELLCKGLKPNTTFSLSSSTFDDNWTLLHEAAEYDAIKSSRVLIDYGADIEKRNGQRRHPLHIASQFNSARVAKLLIKSGASIEQEGVLVWQPLHAAASSDSKDVAKLLIDSGAFIEQKTSTGYTPLHAAAQRNSLAVAKLLLRKGADIESRNIWDGTPLHPAADYNALEVAKLLIDAGANISSKDNVGNTPLHGAASEGSFEVVEVLVDNGADVNAKNNEGGTPLHYAASRNRFDVAKFLVENGASKREKDEDGDTPFDKICSWTWSECSPKEVVRLQRLLKI